MFAQSPFFSCYFGNANDGIMPKDYQSLPKDVALVQHQRFSFLCNKLSINELYFLKQTHSVDGFIVTNKNNVAPFLDKGDFLVTNQPNIGIGVMTADCLPIIFFDTKKKIIAVVHAGWRGSVDSIAVKALATMQKVFATQAHDVNVFFGPSAKVCCYQVDYDFYHNINNDQFFKQRDDDCFFDLPFFNEHQLLNVGVLQKNIITDYNVCTICNTQFCSYRRQGQKAGRQMTVATLARMRD